MGASAEAQLLPNRSRTEYFGRSREKASAEPKLRSYTLFSATEIFILKLEKSSQEKISLLELIGFAAKLFGLPPKCVRTHLNRVKRSHFWPQEKKRTKEKGENGLFLSVLN